MSYHRGPRRLLWFVIGAGTATWWIKHREMNNNGGMTWGHCRRPNIQNTPAPTTASADGSNVNPQDSSFSFRDVPRAINNISPPSRDWGWGWGEKKLAEKHQEEQDQLADLRRQATETMTDITEATLESILSTAEVLKAKLAESRELRKKKEEQLQREIEERSKTPPRLI